MDNQGLSIQDRIKALNQGNRTPPNQKSKSIKPNTNAKGKEWGTQKEVETNLSKPQEDPIYLSPSSKHTRPLTGTAHVQSARKAAGDNNSDRNTGECVYQVPIPKSVNFERENLSMPNTKHTSKEEKSLYECVPKNTPVRSVIGSEAKIANSNEFLSDSGECAYQVPPLKSVNVTHVNRTTPKKEHTNKSEEPLYERLPRNTAVHSVVEREENNEKLNELQSDSYQHGSGNGKETNESSNHHQRDGVQIEQSIADTDPHYAAPSDLPIATAADHERTLLPENIGSRWQRARQTVKESKMRQMVDMSSLATCSISEIASSEGPDTLDSGSVSPNDNLRLRSLQSSCTNTETADAKLTISLPSHSPTGNISRESSWKSNFSYESGTYSDASDTTSSASEHGRPRNVSDASVTYEEDNYVSFHASDTPGFRDPHGNLLATIQADKSQEYRTDRPRPVAGIDDDARARYKKKKKLKAASKFKAAIKAIKPRKLSSTSPNKSHPSTINDATSKSLPASPAKELGRISSPIISVDTETHAIGSRYEPDIATVLTTPALYSFASPIPETQMSNRDESEMDGLYYVPSTPNSRSSSAIRPTAQHPDFRHRVLNGRLAVDEGHSQTQPWQAIRPRSLSNPNEEMINENAPEYRRLSGSYDKTSKMSDTVKPDDHYIDVSKYSISTTHLATLSGPSSDSRNENQDMKDDVVLRSPNTIRRLRPPSMPIMFPPVPPKQSTGEGKESTSTHSNDGTQTERQESQTDKEITQSKISYWTQRESTVENPYTSPNNRYTEKFSGNDVKIQNTEALYYTVDDGRTVNSETKIQDTASKVRNAASKSPTTMTRLNINTAKFKVDSLQNNDTSPEHSAVQSAAVTVDVTSSLRTSGKQNELMKSQSASAENAEKPKSPAMQELFNLVSQRNVAPTVDPSRKVDIESSKSSVSKPAIPAKSAISYKPMLRHHTVDEFNSRITDQGRGESNSSSVRGSSKSLSEVMKAPSSSNFHNKNIPSNIEEAGADNDADQLQPKLRPTIKRPANAPPPRPTVRPPPPPAVHRKSDADAVTDASKSKSAPPKRPPPPSSKSVQAAVERRRIQNVPGDADDEYHDVFVKGGYESDSINIYADIDDCMLPRKTNALKSQAPVPHWKNSMKSPGSTDIFQFNTRKQNSYTSVESHSKSKKISDTKLPEAVYVGIDDYDKTTPRFK